MSWNAARFVVNFAGNWNGVKLDEAHSYVVVAAIQFPTTFFEGNSMVRLLLEAAFVHINPTNKNKLTTC